MSHDIGGDTTHVCKRISWFINNTKGDYIGAYESLCAIAKQRNDIVHRGTSLQVDQNDLNILKISCEAALMWIYNNREKLPTTKHLKYLYEFRTLNKYDTSVISESLKFIQDYIH